MLTCNGGLIYSYIVKYDILSLTYYDFKDIDLFKDLVYNVNTEVAIPTSHLKNESRMNECGDTDIPL